MNNFEFEKEPHVCEDCGSDQWHSTWFWHNGRKRWFEGENEHGDGANWCSECDGEVEIIPESEYEDEEES